MKNQVIKNLTPEMGPYIITYWKSVGVDTERYYGLNNEQDEDIHIYYGVINEGFRPYTVSEQIRGGAEIIPLPNWDYANNCPMNNKPLTWAVKGEEKFLRLFYPDVLEVGYYEGDYSFENTIKKDWLGTDLVGLDPNNTLLDFKRLFVNNNLTHTSSDKIFQLPEQYNEALAFAKAQLEHPYWGSKKKTDVFDRLDNVLGNYQDGKATAEDVMEVADEVNNYLKENPHPNDVLTNK
jgi:hypothetical protein